MYYIKKNQLMLNWLKKNQIYLIYISLVLIFVNYCYAEYAKEYELKGVCIIKFIDYIKWPDKSFGNNNNEFILGILGHNYFDNFFEHFRGKQFKDNNFKIIYFDSVDEIGQPQILFISSSFKNNLENIFKELENKKILTIGDVPDFAEKGGIINLINKEGYISFEININALNRSEIKISSDLLGISKLIENKE